MEIECVTLIYGVEKSFAKLNAIIQQYDLEIVTPSLTEIEAKYSKIFSGSVEYTITAQIVNLGISLEFNNLLQSNRFGVYFSTINDTPILFIKSKSKKYNGGLLGLANAFESIIIQLFTVLRIYKHGDFDILGFFVLDSNRRTLVYDSIRPTSRHFGWEGYSLNNQDVKNLSAEFRKSFKFLKDQHAIGYDILLSSYREDNINLRFIMVIIGLESMLIESSSRGVNLPYLRHSII